MSSTSTPVPRGLDGVVAARTRLSHVDGSAGQLVIGGYELKELAGRVSFEEAAYLLWRGALPNREELGMLNREMAVARKLPPQTMSVLRAAVAASPIDALRMACATLSLDLADPDDISPPGDLAAAKLLTARFPTIVARIYGSRPASSPSPHAKICRTPRTSCTWRSARSRIPSRPRRSTRTG